MKELRKPSKRRLGLLQAQNAILPRVARETQTSYVLEIKKGGVIDAPLLLNTQRVFVLTNNACCANMNLNDMLICSSKQVVKSSDFFVKVPQALLECKSLPSKAIQLYCEIRKLQGYKKQGCYASNQTLGERMGCKERQLRNLLAALRKTGFVKEKILVENASGKKRFKRYLFALDAKCSDGNTLEKTTINVPAENNRETNCQKKNDTGDNLPKAKIISFTAQKTNETLTKTEKQKTMTITSQLDLFQATTETATTTGNAFQATSLAENDTTTAIELFETTLWKHPDTRDIIKERASNKAVSFKRWCTITKNGKYRDVAELIRVRYKEMADARKRDGLSWNALEFFLTPAAKRWEIQWNKLGSSASPFASKTATTINRTTTRTVTQADGVQQASETVSETVTLGNASQFHLRVDYQKGSLPLHWVPLVKKQLAHLCLDDAIYKTWARCDAWNFAPKELKETVATLYDKGFRFNATYQKVLPENTDAFVVNLIKQYATELGKKVSEMDCGWKIVDKAIQQFDVENNFVKTDNPSYTTEVRCMSNGKYLERKPENECVKAPESWYTDFNYAEWIEKNAEYLVKNFLYNDIASYIVNFAIKFIDPLKLTDAKQPQPVEKPLPQKRKCNIMYFPDEIVRLNHD